MNCTEARVPVLLTDAERAAAVVFTDGVLVWKGMPVPAAGVRAVGELVVLSWVLVRVQ